MSFDSLQQNPQAFAFTDTGTLYIHTCMYMQKVYPYKICMKIYAVHIFANISTHELIQWVFHE